MSEPSDTKQIDIWESSPTIFQIKEELDQSVVDGVHVLARVEGPAFFPETTSKNKVFYPIEAWENAINNDWFVNKLNNRLVFGTIGHDIELTDKEIREGLFSHVVTKVWIDEEDKIGKAEYLVLNTPPGRILNTVLRAGSKLRVSTKAGGLFDKRSSQNGTKVIIPESFLLERIDFVIEPGYNQALPQLLESLPGSNSPTNATSVEENTMDKALEILESQVRGLSESGVLKDAKLTEISESLTTLKVDHGRNQIILENYQSLGTYAAINEQMAELAQYHLIGTPQEIHEAFDKGEEAIDDLTNTVKDITEQIEGLDDPAAEVSSDYKTLGSPEEIKTALEGAIKLADEVSAYRELGSVEEITSVLDNADEMTEAIEGDEKSELATKFSVEASIIDELLDKGMDLVEVADLLGKIKPEVSTEVPTDTTTTPPIDTPPVDTPPAYVPPKEDEDEDDKVNESLSSRMLRLGRNRATPINESAKKAQVEDRNATLSTSRAARLMTGNRKSR